MRTKIVPSNELDPGRSLRAGDYIPELGMHTKDGYLRLSLKPAKADVVLEVVRNITAQCFATAVDKGWWEKYDKAPAKWAPEIISSKIALMHSELSEALEELRNRSDMGLRPYFSLPMKDGLGAVIKGARMELGIGRGLAEGAKPEGMAAELADAIIRILDLAAWLDLDIAQALVWKLEYNKTRSHKHGGKNV